MRVLVIGGGLIGLTTAYYLKKRGHQSTVIDRQGGPGRETSFANGSLLSPSMPEPWNTPGCWRVLLSSLGRFDAPLQLRWKELPRLVGWGIEFLANSSIASFERNTTSNVRLALYSLKVMAELNQETGIEYGRTARGALKIYRSSEALARATAAAEQLAAHGLVYRRLSVSETADLEPALAPIASEFAGALHFAADETGDAYRFCVALAEYLRGQGVPLLWSTSVSALEVRSGRVSAVRTGGQRLTADQYIVAAGSYSTPLVRPLGIRLSVRPAKGYSVTFAPRPGTAESSDSPRLLQIPIVDDDMHAAVVPLGSAIRAAGTAEFAGFDLTMRPERVRNLIGLVQKILPQAGLDAETAKSWCGLRPMSADGVPLIGRTRIPNLWVSTGHGHLGWTMAAGSGRLLADLISDDTPSLDPRPYSPARLA